VDTSRTAGDVTSLQAEGVFTQQHLGDAVLDSEDDALEALEPNVKPRPTPVYYKGSSHNWVSISSLQSSEDAVQSPSRCPSLMSSGTLSSRNSSTRSTRSLESMARQLNRRSNEETDGASATANSEHLTKQWAPFPAQFLGLCSRKDRERYLSQRHLLGHCETLVCNFCDCSIRHFATFEGPARVSEFLTHLNRIHGANEAVGPQEPPIHPVYKIPVDVGRWRPRDSPTAKCPVCKELFTAGSMYEHVPGCVDHEITEIAGSRASNDLESGTSIDATTHQRTPIRQCDEGRPSIHDAQNNFDEQPEPVYQRCGDITQLTASSSRLSLVSSRTTTSSEEETDCSEETASRESSPAVSQILHRLTPAKRRLVDAVMQKFQKVFNTTLRSHTTNGSYSGSGGGGTTGSSTTLSSYSDASFVSRKRSLSGSGSTPPDDGDDSNKRRRPDSVSKGKQSVSELRFACPYYKRNPGRHQTFTSCRDPGFTTVSRLK
jgi:hypothetical protein